jgi:AcrR family transcriptional regulator
MTTMTGTPPPTVDSRPSLRERKKIKTREAIRSATYRLVEERGYEATTVEQIAEAAEVSPSTVFRYFPTKEDIVLTDEYDPLLESALRARPHDEPMLTSLRIVIGESLAVQAPTERKEMLLRSHLMLRIPAVRARMTESMSVTAVLLRGLIGERTGLDPDALEVRVFAMAVFGALLEAEMYWADGGFEEDILGIVDRTFAAFENFAAFGTAHGDG